MIIPGGWVLVAGIGVGCMLLALWINIKTYRKLAYRERHKWDDPQPEYLKQ